MKPGDLVCTTRETRMFGRFINGTWVVMALNEGTVGLVIAANPSGPSGSSYVLVLAEGRLGYVWHGDLSTRRRTDRQ